MTYKEPFSTKYVDKLQRLEKFQLWMVKLSDLKYSDYNRTKNHVFEKVSNSERIIKNIKKLELPYTYGN